MRTAHRSLLAAVALTAIVAAPALTAPLNVTISSFVVPGPAAGAQFGFAVESLGDVNFDGVPDSAVGAPGADVVRIYSGADGSVLHTIGDPDGESGTDFGWSLANVGDLTGDGLAEVAIGARGVDQFLPLPCLEPPCEVAPEQGRAFVYSARTGNLLRRLTPANSEFLAFGFAVAGPGDLSGDGVPDVVVGAPTRLNNRFGQVYAFSGANGAVLWVAKEANQALASFGSSVAPLADVNGDGRPDLVVGSPFYDVDAGAGTELAGRISVLSGASGTLIRNHDNPLGAAGENFGLAVSGAGDQSADGVEDYAGGDPGAGRVHLFNGASGAGLGSLSSATPGGEFGASLETSEDRSGDGRRDLWVGEPGAGRVRLVTAGGTDLLTINDPAPGGTPSILGFGFGLAPTPNLGGDAGSDLVIGEPSAVVGPTRQRRGRAPRADHGEPAARGGRRRRRDGRVRRPVGHRRDSRRVGVLGPRRRHAQLHVARRIERDHRHDRRGRSDAPARLAHVQPDRRGPVRRERDGHRHLRGGGYRRPDFDGRADAELALAAEPQAGRRVRNCDGDGHVRRVAVARARLDHEQRARQRIGRR